MFFFLKSVFWNLRRNCHKVKLPVVGTEAITPQVIQQTHPQHGYLMSGSPTPNMPPQMMMPPHMQQQQKQQQQQQQQFMYASQQYHPQQQLQRNPSAATQ